MSETLTPERIHEIMRKHLGMSEQSEIAAAITAEPDRFAALILTFAGWHEERDVAAAMLRTARQVRVPGGAS